MSGEIHERPHSVDVPRIYCGVPAYRSRVHPNLLVALAELVQAFPVQFRYYDSPDVVYAHNLFTLEALDAGADWCWIFGADQWLVDARWLARAFLASWPDDVAVVGAPVAFRGDGDRLAVQAAEGHHLKAPCEVRETFEVKRIGSGCVMLRLAWFREHWNEEPIWWQNRYELKPGKPRTLERWGLDYSFCDRVRLLGGRILCEPRIAVYHEAIIKEVCGTSFVKLGGKNGEPRNTDRASGPDLPAGGAEGEAREKA